MASESSDPLVRIENRLEALDRKLDERFSAIDRRFAVVDERFAAVDDRFGQIHQRFDEEHSFFKALYEASRSDFNNLYDFVKAHAESTDPRFERLDKDLDARFADVFAAIAAARRV